MPYVRLPTAKTLVLLPTLWMTKRASAPRGAAWAERMNFVLVIVTLTVTYRSGAVVCGSARDPSSRLRLSGHREHRRHAGQTTHRMCAIS